MNNVRTVRFGLIGIGLLSLAGSLASFSPTVVETLTPLGPKDVVHSIAEAFLFGRGGELVENRLHQGEVEHVLAQLGAPISRRYRRPLAEVERMNIEVVLYSYKKGSPNEITFALYDDRRAYRTHPIEGAVAHYGIDYTNPDVVIPYDGEQVRIYLRNTLGVMFFESWGPQHDAFVERVSVILLRPFEETARQLLFAGLGWFLFIVFLACVTLYRLFRYASLLSPNHPVQLTVSAYVQGKTSGMLKEEFLQQTAREQADAYRAQMKAAHDAAQERAKEKHATDLLEEGRTLGVGGEVEAFLAEGNIPGAEQCLETAKRRRRFIAEASAFGPHPERVMIMFLDAGENAGLTPTDLLHRFASVQRCATRIAHIPASFRDDIEDRIIGLESRYLRSGFDRELKGVDRAIDESERRYVEYVEHTRKTAG